MLAIAATVLHAAVAQGRLATLSALADTVVTEEVLTAPTPNDVSLEAVTTRSVATQTSAGD